VLPELGSISNYGYQIYMGNIMRNHLSWFPHNFPPFLH
jgi:hypothetical protein